MCVKQRRTIKKIHASLRLSNVSTPGDCGQQVTNQCVFNTHTKQKMGAESQVTSKFREVTKKSIRT
jgi:hypothetical protein